MMQQNGKIFKIIAETAFSHEGSYEYLKNQVMAAADGGADIVKFQVLLNPKSVYLLNSESLRLAEQWLLDKSDWIKILEFAKCKGLQILVMPLDIEAVEFVRKHIEYVDYIEVHSISVNEVHLLKALSEINKNIFVGAGGRYYSEIEYLLAKANRTKEQIVIMHGFQSFPTCKYMTNLSKIGMYHSNFRFNNIGYADHSDYKSEEYIEMSKYAYVLGARYFEKHIVVNQGEERIDYESAIDSKGLRKLRSEIDDLILVLGSSDINILNDKEFDYRNREKTIVSIKKIRKGERLSENNIGYRITEFKSDFQQCQFDSLIGEFANSEIPIYTPIIKNHIV